MRAQFVKESFFSASQKDLFQFHERKDAFALLTPPNHNIDVLSQASTLRPSEDVVRFVASFLFLKFQFEMIHTVYKPDVLFIDEQKKGLFSSWQHRHRFISGGWINDPAVMLQDHIEYTHLLVPFLRPFVNHRMEGLFRHRHLITAKELKQGSAESKKAALPGHVVITGATGLIGRRITQILVEKGISVTALVRNVEKGKKVLGSDVNCVYWDFNRPEQGDWRAWLNNAAGVIHLAGTPLFQQRWTPAFKEEMEKSRVLSTRQLVDAIKGQERRPCVFVSASALGIYGTDPGRVVTEEARPADDLLARICINWEKEAQRLEQAGVRSVQIRTGIVLSTESGALKEMLPIFRLGLGGTLGYHDHWINWIHLEDIARIFVMALLNNDLKGPYNAAAPHPVMMKDFALTLSRVLRRPCLLRFPTSILKIAIGEAGEYTSGGARVLVDSIQKEGYLFFFENLEDALRSILRRPRP